MQICKAKAIVNDMQNVVDNLDKYQAYLDSNYTSEYLETLADKANLNISILNLLASSSVKIWSLMKKYEKLIDDTEIDDSLL